ncbi:MAG: ABC transporter ATP-binding protein [Ardenticatenaceae bacterium]|nr:ABC transporter ATP-binding protein [Ardenticatenaceae bacterium]
MAEAILHAENVSKYFGGLCAVDGVTVSVAPGSLHSVIGPNGAGKTTFFNLLSGVLRADSGRISFKGRDITRLPLHRIAHLGIGRSFQITNLFPQLTVLENVRLAAQARGHDNFRILEQFTAFPAYIERAERAIAAVGLAGKEYVPANALPHGDKRKLELAILLAPDPELLLLDEPTAGMASEQVSELLAIIQGVRRDAGKTIMLVEHNMNVVMNVSDRITVMHQGQVIAEGTAAEIAANETVQVAYLGGLYQEEIRNVMREV